MAARPTVLHVTDLTYPANGRRYGDEDAHLSARLREEFTVALCHPVDAVRLMDGFDAVLVRNSGPVLHHRAAYDEFRARAAAHGTRVLNPLTGRGDMAGKGYLVELTAAGYPVIPTADRSEHLDRLPQAPAYIVKPVQGADSIGLRTVAPDDLPGLALDGLLVQPRIDFRYEVSFYFVDRVFQYALHAPRPDRRWQLAPYRADAADVEFARRFVDWNTLDHGIQRVDACRTRDGRLLLVELEDLNPYLSLGLLGTDVRDSFVTAVKRSLRSVLDTA